LINLIPKSANSRKSLPISLLFLPIFTICIGLYFSVQADRAKQQEDKTLVEDQLKKEVSSFRQQVIEKLTFYSYGLNALDSLIAVVGQDNFDSLVMQSFANSRDFESEYPGVRGFGFIEHIASSKLTELVAKQEKIRSDGKFSIRHLSDNSSAFYIIRDIQPEAKNASAIGLNIGSERIRAQAATTAALKNEATLTGPITLVQANKNIKKGFLLLKPTYYENADKTTYNTFLDATWGWTYAPIVIDEVVNSIAGIGNNLLVSISDTTADDGRFYESDVNTNTLSDHSYQEQITIFGRNWSFKGQATKRFVNDIVRPDGLNVFSLSIILTLLVSMTVFFIHLFVIRQLQAKTYIAELAVAKETALADTNKQLETIVEARTNQIKKTDSFKDAILKSSSYPIIATDTQGLITAFNPAAEKLLGYSAEEMIGIETPAKFHLMEEVVQRAKELSIQKNLDIQAGFAVFTINALSNGKEERDWTYVNKSGAKISVSLSVTSLIDDDLKNVGFLGVAYDLTERLEKEEIILYEKEKAQKATLAKTEFLANMSHEIRTPLNGIQGALQILQESNLNRESLSLVEIALYSTKSLMFLLNDILDISKVEAGKIEIVESPFSMDSVFAFVQQNSAVMAKDKNIDIRFENHLGSSIFLGDKLRIKQILMNIVSNAIKFTEAGTVSVNFSYSTKDEVVFTVCDTGIGMDTDAISTLFKRFEQADLSITRKFGGTGLGMAISKSLVELMNGKLSVVSKVDVGSTFTVRLPLKSQPTSISSLSTEVSENIELSPFKILVAEDNSINQVIIQTMLAQVGGRITLVDNGQQAIDALAKESFDLILMDIQMPVMDGIQACKKIKNTYFDLPILAITANVYAQDIKEYKAIGFDGCLGKPFEKKALIAIVHTHLTQKSLALN
jgi:PAS domain S-box-containing protein